MKQSFFSLLTFVFLIMILSGCRKELGPTDIRIKYVSNYTYNDVEVNTSHGIQNYGIVLSGHTTEYKRFEKAYREAQIELFIENEKYVFIPVDYTYEIPLGRGKFTYEISADTVKMELSIHVEADAPL